MEKYTRLQRELEETDKLLKSSSNTVPGISNPFPVSDPILSSDPYTSGVVGEDVRDQLYEAGYEGNSSLVSKKKIDIEAHLDWSNCLVNFFLKY